MCTALLSLRIKYSYLYIFNNHTDLSCLVLKSYLINNYTCCFSHQGQKSGSTKCTGH